MEIRQGVLADKKQLIEFANKIFFNGSSEFEKLLPNIYGKNVNTSKNHLMLFENKKLKAIALKQPLRMKVERTILKVGAVGTVAVSPSARLHGFMSLLMDEICKQLEDEQYDLAFLGGQRKRYARWGFEPSGTQIYYVITKKSLQSFAQSNLQIEFRSLAEVGQQDINEAYCLWQQQIFRTIRSEVNFVATLQAKKSTPYFVFLHNKFLGYFVLSDNKSNPRLHEILLENEKLLKPVIEEIFNKFSLETLGMKVSPHQTEFLLVLQEICEQEVLGANHKFKVINWQNVLQALLDLKTTYATLVDGQQNFIITDERGTEYFLSVKVKNHLPYVIKLDPSSTQLIQEKTVSMSAVEAQRIMFTPALSEQNIKDRLPSNWFPLPLFISELDSC